MSSIYRKKELWHEIAEYENKYYVSNHGNIKNNKNRILSFSISNSGYKVSHLYLNSKRTHFYIHILVATYFCSNPENKKWVNHKDGDKLNCYFENLEFSTPTENNNHAKRIGLNNNYGETSGNAKLTNVQVNEIKSLFGTITQNEIAKIYNVSFSCISDIKTGRRRNSIYEK